MASSIGYPEDLGTVESLGENGRTQHYLLYPQKPPNCSPVNKSGVKIRLHSIYPSKANCGDIAERKGEEEDKLHRSTYFCQYIPAASGPFSTPGALKLV